MRIRDNQRLENGRLWSIERLRVKGFDVKTPWSGSWLTKLCRATAPATRSDFISQLPDHGGQEAGNPFASHVMQINSLGLIAASSPKRVSTRQKTCRVCFIGSIGLRINSLLYHDCSHMCIHRARHAAKAVHSPKTESGWIVRPMFALDSVIVGHLGSMGQNAGQTR